MSENTPSPREHFDEHILAAVEDTANGNRAYLTWNGWESPGNEPLADLLNAFSSLSDLNPSRGDGVSYMISRALEIPSLRLVYRVQFPNEPGRVY